jgi:3-(3-hydroxy-phenyl)propionate hydroxylase
LAGETIDCQVLVVGLGPVGATLAALLAQRGVETLAIERDAEVYPLPRAVHFDHEIMRLFQSLGVADAVAAHAREAPAYEFRAADGGVLLRLGRAPQSESGWSSGYMFHQPGLEATLRRLLADSPQAAVRLGWRFEGLAQDADGVTAQVATPEGPKSVRARFLVGCDGASSPVREAMGVGLVDFQFDEPWLVVDAKVPPGARTPDLNLQICDPARPTTCVLGGPGRHRWEFMLLPGEASEQMLDDTLIAGLIAPWDCGPLEIERKAVYRFHGLTADRWRRGRVLLAGDAAHQMPPFAGQGMCSGLRDAANLAWKLEAILAGQADGGLLDSYQAERDPHVRALIQLAIGMGRVVCTLDPDAAAARDADMLAARAAGGQALPPPRPTPFAEGCVLKGSPGAGELFPQPTLGAGADRVRLDDVLGPGAWLISRSPGGTPREGLRVVDLDAEVQAPWRPALQEWLAERGAAAVLVRPDRYVFGTGEPAALAAGWIEALGSDAPAVHAAEPAAT